MSVTNGKKGLKAKLVLNKILIFLEVIFASMLTELAAIVFLSSKNSNMPREAITIISLALVVIVSLVVSRLNNRQVPIKVFVKTNVVAPVGGLIISMLDYFFKETAEEFLDSWMADRLFEIFFSNMSPIAGGIIIFLIMIATFIVVFCLQRFEPKLQYKLQELYFLTYEDYVLYQEYEHKLDKIKSGFVVGSLVITVFVIGAWLGIILS